MGTVMQHATRVGMGIPIEPPKVRPAGGGHPDASPGDPSGGRTARRRRSRRTGSDRPAVETAAMPIATAPLPPRAEPAGNPVGRSLPDGHGANHWGAGSALQPGRVRIAYLPSAPSLARFPNLASTSTGGCTGGCCCSESKGRDTCPCLTGLPVVMDVIDMLVQIPFIAEAMFPKPPLQNRLFARALPAGAGVGRTTVSVPTQLRAGQVARGD
jgi:hypothetical protein